MSSMFTLHSWKKLTHGSQTQSTPIMQELCASFRKSAKLSSHVESTFNVKGPPSPKGETDGSHHSQTVPVNNETQSMGDRMSKAITRTRDKVKATPHRMHVTHRKD